MISQQRWCGFARSADDGHTWQSGILIGAGGQMAVPEGFGACWNPSVVFGPSGTLYYLFQSSRSASDPYSHVLMAVSNDGGASFAPPHAVDPGSPTYPAGERAGGDWWPAMAVDPHRGSLFVTWSRFTPDLDSSMVMDAVSADGGTTFASPVRVSPVDEWDVTGSTVTVGADGGANIIWFDYTQWERGNVSAACGSAGCCSCGSTLAERTQAIRDLYAEEGTRYDFVQGVGCEGFAASVDVHRTVGGPFPGRGGECDLPGLVRAAVSGDGGASFSTRAVPGTPVYLGCFVGDTDFGNPNAGQYGQPPPPSPTHVCDRTHYSNFIHNSVRSAAGAAAGQLLATWWNDDTPDASGAARLSVAFSSDGAQSWRTATPVGVPDGGAVEQQHHPAIAVAPDGRVDLVYYDLTPGTDQNVYVASSEHPGGAFSALQRVNARPVDASVGPLSDDFRVSFGDEIVVASTDGAALVAWTGTTASHQQIDFARVVAIPTAAMGSKSTIPLALITIPAAGAVIAVSAAAAVVVALRRRRGAANPRPVSRP